MTTTLITTARRMITAGAALASVAAISVALAPAASANTPGQPGTPSAGIPVYTENFENGMGTTPVKMTGYIGAAGMTFSADPAYDGTNCNGLIVSYNTPQPSGNPYGCCDATNPSDNIYPGLTKLVQALGGLPGGPGNPADNHAVAAYTHHGSEPANAVVFQSNSSMSLVSTNRFVTFSVDAAAKSCQLSHSQLKFYLVDGATQTALFNTPIDPCGGSVQSGVTEVGTNAADHALLYTGGQFGIRLRNGSTAGDNGNDFAFDNIRVVDVTPQLDTAFDADTITTGDTSQLTFTITNTSELAEKDGWSYSAPLPNGVTATGNGTTTCAAAAIDTSNGTVTVTGGDIATGVTSCTVTIPVTAANAGTYTLHNYDVTVTGIDRPANATLTVAVEAGAPMVSWQAGSIALVIALIAGAGLFALRSRRASA